MPHNELNALRVLLHLTFMPILRWVLLFLYADEEAKAQTPSKRQSQNTNQDLLELHYRLGKMSPTVTDMLLQPHGTKNYLLRRKIIFIFLNTIISINCLININCNISQYDY